MPKIISENHTLNKKLLVSVALSLAFVASAEDRALAQTSDVPSAQTATEIGRAPVKVAIPPSSLFDAVQTLSRQAGIAITILPDVPAETPTPGISGEFSAEQALNRLLAGSGIPFRAANGAIIVGRQSGQDNLEVLRPVSVIGTMPMVAMPTGNGNSGLSVIGEDAIKAIGTGDKDPVRLLRVLPNVNWDNNQFAVSQSGGTGTLSEQDLTPERVSISGGKVYENKFMIDGMNNVSGFDVTSTNEGDADKIGINNPMALFVNSDVLKEVAVYDSNVPARYSGFTGGVVDMRTRDPADKFRGAVGYARESGDWVHYRNEGEEFNASENKPDFTKNSYDLSVDVPVNDKLRTMFAASRVTAEQRRTPTAAYANDEKGATQSVRASYLGALSGQINDDTTASVKFLYAPYSQEYTRANAIDDRQITKGDNYSVNGEIRHETDAFTANLALGMSQSGYERDTQQDVGYYWLRTGSRASTCLSGTNCTEGSFGDIADTQRNFQAKGDIGTTALGVDWATGFDLDQGMLKRSRDQTNVWYTNAVAAPTIVCPAGDPACISGEQVLRTRQFYLARDVEVNVLNAGYWAEGSKNIGIHTGLVESLDIRAGLRGDYGDYQGNLNWAPRFSTTLNFAERVGLTFGANRYYSTDTLTYALYQSSPSVLTQTRTWVGGVLGNWTTPAAKYQFAPAEVRTPYSDERVVALTMPLLWGDGRVKALTRRTRDEISQTMTVVGGNITRTPNNNGWTNYKSFSLEWQKNMQNHAFLINGSLSETERSSESYMDIGDDESTTGVYYQGSIMKRGQLPMLADNFSQPIVINATWTSKWLEDALTVNVTGKYRFERDEIIDTDKDVTIGGKSYSVWERVTRPPQARFDLTAAYKIDTWNEQNLELFAYVENVFNARSYTASASAPLERGRAFWFGTRYNF